MNGKHAIYRVYQALCAGMLRLFPAGRQTLVQGDGCITRIPEVLKTHGIKRCRVITTPGTIRRGTIAPLLAQCEDAGIRTVLYTEVSPDPTVAEVEAAAECFLYPAVRRSLPSEAALLWTVPRWRERAQ